MLFRRLIAVGNPAYRYRLRDPFRRAKLFSQKLGGILFYENLCFEIKPRGEPQVFVRGPCVAVNASVLASPVGIDARVKGNIGTLVVGDYGFRPVPVVNGSGGAVSGGRILVRNKINPPRTFPQGSPGIPFLLCMASLYKSPLNQKAPKRQRPPRGF